MAGKVIKADEWRSIDLPSGALVRLLDGHEHGVDDVGFIRSDFPQGSGTGEHRHPFVAATYVIAGRGVFTIDGVVHHASAGEMIVFPADTWHSIDNESDELLQVVGIDFGSGPHATEFR